MLLCCVGNSVASRLPELKRVDEIATETPLVVSVVSGASAISPSLTAQKLCEKTSEKEQPIASETDSISPIDIAIIRKPPASPIYSDAKSDILRFCTRLTQTGYYTEFKNFSLDVTIHNLNIIILELMRLLYLSNAPEVPCSKKRCIRMLDEISMPLLTDESLLTTPFENDCYLPEPFVSRLSEQHRYLTCSTFPHLKCFKDTIDVAIAMVPNKYLGFIMKYKLMPQAVNIEIAPDMNLNNTVYTFFRICTAEETQERLEALLETDE